VVYHNPLQHLGGPGGHTLYTFDFLTTTWAKVHVSGFESAKLRAIGMHHGQVSELAEQLLCAAHSVSMC